MFPRQSRENRAPRAGDSARQAYEADRAQWRTDRLRLAGRLAVWVVPAAALFGLYVGAVTHFGAFGIITAALVVAGSVDVLLVKPGRLEVNRERADGEARTAQMLRPVARRGFHLLFDRVLNSDASLSVPLFVVGPTGMYLIDSRNWTAGPAPRLIGNELWRGHDSQSAGISSLRERAVRLAQELGSVTGGVVPVQAVLALHAADVAGTPRDMAGVLIVQRDQLLQIMERRPRIWGADMVRSVAEEADRILVSRGITSASVSLAP